MPVTAALITAGTTAAISLGKAAVQNSRAKKIAKANLRPDYVASEQIKENQRLAASLAGTGLSDSTRINAEQSAERNLSQSLNAILRAGGDGNQIADLYANNSDAMLKLAGADAELQRFNISQYLGANAALGGEKQTAWQVNEFAPYANNAQLAAQLRANAMQNASQGINSASQGVSNYLLQDLYKGGANKSVGSNTNPNGDNILGAFDTANSFSDGRQSKLAYNDLTQDGLLHYAWNDSRSNAATDDFGKMRSSASNRYLKGAIKSGYDPAYQDLLNNAYKTSW